MESSASSAGQRRRACAGSAAFDVREAIRARSAAGPEARIFSWLTVGRTEIAEALAADIDLGVGDAGFLEDIAAVAGEAGAVARVHLKIDTGLHRNGIRPEDWPVVLERSRALEHDGVVRIVGVWSHIAEASDREDDDARTLFDDAVTAAEAVGIHPRGPSPRRECRVVRAAGVPL